MTLQGTLCPQKTTGGGGYNTKDFWGAWCYKSQIRKKRPNF